MPEPPAAALLDDLRFAALMAPLGPFEARPQLAVAVSGGPDSLALGLLADRWARQRGGAVTGLIVDHGLRPEAAREARQTAAWLAARGVPAHILTWLTWPGPKPVAGIQAAARAARYRLLGDWCRAAGVLHLLAAHHRDDQAETVALRQARGSGPDGLAGMAAVRELPGLRLLRPLLGVPKAALRALLEAEGQPWHDDPSNRAPAFARARLRAAATLDVARLERLAQHHGVARAARACKVAAWLAQNARVCPAGFVLIAAAELAMAPLEIARSALQQALLTVGARPYPPRRARLDRLLAALRADHRPAGRTLAGCRLLRHGDRLLICREPGAITEVLAPEPGVWHRWDGRFALRLTGPVADLRVRALGVDGWRQRSTLDALAAGNAPETLAAVNAPDALAAGNAPDTLGAMNVPDALAVPARCAPVPTLPAAVGPSLPAVWRGDRLLAVPQLGLIAQGEAARLVVEARWRPPQPLAGAPFAVSPAPCRMAGDE